MRLSAYLAIMLLLLSCSGQKQQEKGTEIPLSYAKLLKIYDCGDHRRVEIFDPWNTDRILHEYTIPTLDDNLDVDHDANLDLDSATANNPQPTTNNHSLISTTATHAWLLNELGARQCIAGLCDKDYVVSPFARDIPDCGRSQNPDIEKIVTLQPTAIIVSPFHNSGGYGKMEQLGIEIIEAADYMETTPLARAEWMIFYGMLVGKEQEARALFKQIEEKYKNVLNVSESSDGSDGSDGYDGYESSEGSEGSDNQQPTTNYQQPKIMTDLQVVSAWYVPGGNSTTAHYIADAGGSYAFANNKDSGSIPVSFETMLQKNLNADIWMIKYNAKTDLTLSQMRQDKEGYAQFRAYKMQRVYGCNTAKNNYFEVAPWRPDIILQEYRHIINQADDSLVYFRRLK